jgi:hypothetical protein
VAQDRDIQHDMAPAKAPVSAHPAFPAIVGLWFAALLGLGTIVMPAVVLEQIATATGLASVFPPAEPPLSAAGRGMFALLATLLGLIGGLALARRVARAHDTARPTRRRTAGGRSTPPRPLSVIDDLGEEAIAAPAIAGALPGRRRALAVTDEAQPSEFLMTAPLPGESDVPELSLEPHEEPMSERPSEFDAPQATDELDLGVLTSAPAEVPVIPAYVPELDTRKPRAVTAPPAPATDPVAETASEPIDPFTAPLAEAPIDKPLEDLGMVQLAERLGRSLQQRLIVREAEAEAEAEAAAEALSFSAPSFDHEDQTLAVPPPVVPEALRAFMDVAPEEFAPETHEPADVVPLAAEVVEAEAADDEVQMPPPVVPSALMPFAFAPFGPEDDDDELDAGPFTLPLSTMLPRPFDAPVVPQDEAVEAVEADDGEEVEDDALVAEDESYSSLLAMNNPFRQREEFVRIDEPEAEADDLEPAVVFPGHEQLAPQAAAEGPGEDVEAPSSVRPFDAPHQSLNQPAPSTAPVRTRAAADAAETERALRSALANLQRMSGAA